MQILINGKSSWLNYHHLYYFSVVAREGTIAGAAEKLRIGQPTLSVQIKQFEDSLGHKLFDRSHRKLQLNETGRLVQDYATQIFRVGTELVEVLHDQPDARRIHVQIGALDSVPKHLMLALSKAAYLAGNCTVSILEGKSDELLQELLAFRIDLMVSNFVPSPAGASGLYSRRIARTPILVCGSSRFRKLKAGFPESISQQPFIMPTVDSKVRHDIDHYLRLSGLQVDVIAETQDTAIQKLMGLDGLGLIPAPLVAVKEYLRKRTLFEIGRLEGVSEDLYLISASRRVANPISSALMKGFSLNSPHSQVKRSK